MSLVPSFTIGQLGLLLSSIASLKFDLLSPLPHLVGGLPAFEHILEVLIFRFAHLCYNSLSISSMLFNGRVEFCEFSDIVRELNHSGKSSPRDGRSIIATKPRKHAHWLLREQGLM